MALGARMGRLPRGAHRAPKPGARSRAGPNLAVLQEALAEAGFDPRFRRTGAPAVEITLRDCPFRDLLDEHRELVCAVHRGLLEGMLDALAAARCAWSRSSRCADRTSVCSLVARVD